MSNGDGGGNAVSDSGGDTTSGSGIQERTLSFASVFASNNWRSKQVEQYFMDRVTELTNGKIQWNYHPNKELGSYGETLSLIQQGTVDAGITAPPWIADAMYLSSVANLPGFQGRVKAKSRAYWDLVAPHKDGTLFEAEIKDQNIRPIFAGTVGPYQIYSKSKYETLSDMEGVTIAATGNVSIWAVESLGSNPVNIGGTDQYTAMQRGTIDAGTSPYDTLESASVDEVSKYCTENVQMGTFSSMWSIDLGIWQDLSEDAKEAFKTAGDETITKWTDGISRENQSAKESMQDSLEFYSVNNPGDWNDRLSNVYPKWVDNASDTETAQKVVDKFESNLSGSS